MELPREKADELATTGQDDRLVEGTRPGHLKASNEPGRVALVRRIVSLRTLAAFVAAHRGAELIERHRTEHRDSLAEHPERHPDRSLAALASDPGITSASSCEIVRLFAIRALKRDRGGSANRAFGRQGQSRATTLVDVHKSAKNNRPVEY
jgi:hypothetical protein